MSARETLEFPVPHAAFNLTATCVKCGCEMVTTTYVAREVITCTDVLYVVTEHLRRTCVRCGHAWKERTLDAGATP